MNPHSGERPYGIPWQDIAATLKKMKWTLTSDMSSFQTYRRPDKGSKAFKFIFRLEKKTYDILCLAQLFQKHGISTEQFTCKLREVHAENKP